MSVFVSALHAYDLGYQNILKVDPQTGQVTCNEGMIPQIGVQLDICPSTAGFKAQRAMAYSAVRGRQHVAVPAWRPDIRRPGGGNSLLVFAVPGADDTRQRFVRTGTAASP